MLAFYKQLGVCAFCHGACISHLPSHNILLPLDVKQSANVVRVSLNLLHARGHPSPLVAVGVRGWID